MQSVKPVLLTTLLVLLLCSPAWGDIPLPKALQELPMYPGAVVTHTLDMSGGTVNAMFEVEASMDDVLAFFIEAFEDTSWEKNMEVRQKDGCMLNYSTDSLSLAIALSPMENHKVQYTLILSTME